MNISKPRVSSIDIERVDLEIDLTAGVAVASNVFAWIDTNRDGEISQAEGESYARADAPFSRAQSRRLICADRYLKSASFRHSAI